MLAFGTSNLISFRMHSKNHLKKFMQLKKKGAIECQDIEQMHTFFETFLKYIALTYLRMQGGKHAVMQRFVRKSWLSCNEKTLKKLLLHFFNQDKRNQQHWLNLMDQYPAMKVQIQLLFSCASKVRNYIFHSNYYPFQKEEKRFIFDIYTDCIQAIEHLIALRNKDRTIFDNSADEFGGRPTQFVQLGQPMPKN